MTFSHSNHGPTQPTAPAILTDKPRVLMFAPGFVPHMASENIVSGKLALAMTGAGWDLTVVSRPDTGFAYAADWAEPFASLQDITHEIDYPRGGAAQRAVELLRQGLTHRHPIEGLRWADRAAEYALNLHRKQPFDVILSRSPMAAGHLPALRLVRLTGLPWIANWNDPPEGLWPAPYPNPRGPINRWRFDRYNRAVMNAASVNTFPSERLRDHVLRAVGGADAIVTEVIPHVGLVGHQPAPRQKVGLFKLCHAGHLHPNRNPEAFFEGVARFVARSGIGDELSIQVLGVEDVDLRRLAGFYGLGARLNFTGPVPYEQAMTLLADQDVNVLIEADCDEGVFLPSKLVDYTQVGRPILALSPRRGTANDLLARGGGLAVSGADAWAVAEALGRLHQAWKHDRLESGYASTWLYEPYSPGAVMGAYRRVLGPLLGSRAAPVRSFAA
ncbi:MAG: glycosyltransferase family protein [Planctomycetota bacterium]|jgi:glycosyltransferase involved in cell wall biosynthesis